ncbi:MAG: hypothetical protein RLZZ244_2152 [Verrucomicrobiota bacterium]|jgi:transcriptional regulator with XRE-family HTH domain
MKTHNNTQNTTRRFESVRELLTRPEDKAVRDQFDALTAQTRLVQELTLMRTRAGLSQAQLAAKMGCTQGRISKIESSLDADLTIGIVQAYARATFSDMKIWFLKPSKQVARSGARGTLVSKKPHTPMRAPKKTGLKATASARKSAKTAAKRRVVSV